MMETKRKRKTTNDEDEDEDEIPAAKVARTISRTRPWTVEEDNYLRQLCTIPEVFNSWDIVGTHINCSGEDCAKRWQVLVAKPPVIFLGKAKKFIKWTPEEDKRLLELSLVRPKLSNKRIACMIQTRTEAQCNNRWRSHVNPDLRVGPWSEEENKAIMSGRKEEMSWSNIIKTYACLTNRPNLAVKNQWYSLDRAKRAKELTKSTKLLTAASSSELSISFESFGREASSATKIGSWTTSMPVDL